MTKEHPDEELLNRIKAREELEKRGYRRMRCVRCATLGNIPIAHDYCPTCRGTGYTWESPIMS